MRRAVVALVATVLLPILLIGCTAEIVVVMLKGVVARADAGDPDCVYIPPATTTPDSTPDLTTTTVPEEKGSPEGTGSVSIELVLLTIRTRESGGSYVARAPKGTASGAYQFIDQTWGNFGGYSSAWLAPPAVQDQRARILVEPILAKWGLSGVPVAWYYPRALTSPEWMDRVPNPEYGNTLTVRQYQAAWLETYRQLAGGVLPIDGCNLAGGGGSVGIGGVVPADIAPVIAYAQAQLGKPYLWGGAGPEAFDCSGLTMRAYQQIRINLPHKSAAQAQYGIAVNWRSDGIRPGDLMFHRGSVPVHDFGHVGIAVSATHWIVAPKSGDVVSLRPIPFDRIQSVRRLVQPKETA